MTSLSLLLDWVQNPIVTLLAFVGTCLIIISNGLHCLTNCCGFQWWIQDFTKLYEIERIWTPRGGVPHALLRSATGFGELGVK